ncbi:MAG: Hsp20/alpha crystallin family protein, partial [Acetatifactor sp.]|nr:Hsp20/alpha crystallin family protein [Acetatifactor sp.]
MMMPSIFRDNLFDSLMEDFTFPDISRTLYGKSANNLMMRDVQDSDAEYIVDRAVPGFKKDDLR